MALDGSNESHSSTLGQSRLVLGLAQGVVLLLLVKAGETNTWPATDKHLIATLFVIAVLLPPTILAGLGQMRAAMLGLWTLAATSAVVYIVQHAFMREASTSDFDGAGILLLLPAALFVAYHLLAAAAHDRRPIAHFRTYFDISWKNGVQLALSLLFVGAFWLLLFLGAALFDLIRIDAVSELIRRDWFAYPASAVVFALAVHVSDMRVGLIAGARTLALVLLSWLLPLMTFFAVAFLCALPLAGIELLWATGNATALLLTSAGVLVVLINAAYQHGDPAAPPHAIVRAAARLAALALLAIVAIAAYSIWLRIAQHGLTPDRVAAVALVAVAACHALGYAIAALWPGRWMHPVELTNIATAFVFVFVVVALLTPIADPARIAVADQVRRLQSGIVSPEKFDFDFLRFRSARYGVEALKALAADKSNPRAQAIAVKAEAALARERQDPFKPELAPRDALAKLPVHPKGAQLPESFLTQDWNGVPYSPVLCANFDMPANTCEAFLADFDADGVAEIMTGNRHRLNVWRLSREKMWKFIGAIEPDECPGRTGETIVDALRAGRFKTIPPSIADLEVDGNRLRLQGCGPQ